MEPINILALLQFLLLADGRISCPLTSLINMVVPWCPEHIFWNSFSSIAGHKQMNFTCETTLIFLLKI